MSDGLNWPMGKEYRKAMVIRRRTPTFGEKIKGFFFFPLFLHSPLSTFNTRFSLRFDLLLLHSFHSIRFNAFCFLMPWIFVSYFFQGLFRGGVGLLGMELVLGRSFFLGGWGGGVPREEI
ncbi:unnamed protein product [Citrullus colocynthis]|uniref:Transmembrane protein n=1 Tax=Citrullus colocynthis TaxID=252529 RepID=A0ABP0Y2K3_9ROSI